MEKSAKHKQVRKRVSCQLQSENRQTVINAPGKLLQTRLFFIRVTAKEKMNFPSDLEHKSYFKQLW